jgi:2-polyprenyl-3-methyl-5-hydroxy-6-metoxy-1,4-benzoquinol methylase
MPRESSLPTGAPRCPLCGSSAARLLYRFERSRWIPGTVVRCAGCRVIFKQPSSAIPLAEYYDAGYAALDYWNEAAASTRALERLLAGVMRVTPPAGATLLDIGCGAGSFLGLAKSAGYRVTGLEVNPQLAERARTTGAEIVVADIASMALGARRFDVVTAFDIIEHLLDPIDMLARCADLLVPGGHLAVYTPNHASLIARTASFLYSMSGGRVRGPVAEIFDGLHVVFFDPRTLRMAIERARLAIVASEMIKYDPARSNQAGRVSAAALRLLEAVSPLVHGQFRMFMIARKAVTA